MICISVHSKETTTDLKLKYLHYGPGLNDPGLFERWMPGEISIHLY